MVGAEQTSGLTHRRGAEACAGPVGDPAVEGDTDHGDVGTVHLVDISDPSNPTFVDDQKRIRVTSGSNAQLTRTYVTTIGLYDQNDNLLAVAKLSRPIAKSPESEANFRVRLDF